MPRALILAALLAGCADTQVASLGEEEPDAGRLIPWPPPGLEACDLAPLARELRDAYEDAGISPTCRVNPFSKDCPALELALASQACASALAKLIGAPSPTDAGDR